MEVADPFLLVDFEEAIFVSRFDQVFVVIRQSRQGRKEFQDSDLVADVGNIESKHGRLLNIPTCETHVGFYLRLVLNVGGICSVCTSPLPAPFGVAIDLTLITSLRGERIVIHFTAGRWLWASSAHADSRNTVPLAYPEVTRWAATQVATLSVGAAVTAGGLRRATFIDVLAPSAELFVLEAGGAHALVAAQSVVTGGSSTNVCTEALVLIDTLVPLVVLEIALGAAASVAPNDVLAAVLTAMVSFALIHIFTAGATLIKRESSLTFTGEAPRSILANTLRPTQVDVRSAFIVINAGGMVLGKSRRTFTCEAADGVNTQELAVVLLSCTLIKIFAAPSILLQNVAFRARTLETPFCIFADKIAGFGSLVTLIQIYAGSSSYICSVAIFTYAMI